MLLGDKIIKSGILSWATMNIAGQNVGVGSTVTIGGPYTMPVGRHGIVRQMSYYASDVRDGCRLYLRIGGAMVEEGGFQIPNWTGGTEGRIDITELGIYIPPNAAIDVRCRNFSAANVTKLTGFTLLYLWYDTDVAYEVGTPECPAWLRNPPEWFKMAIQNIRGG